MYRQRPFRSCRAWENLRNRMSAPRLPQKFVKVGRKPNVKVKKNSSCRFCGVNFSSGGGPASFENLFSPSGRVESAGLNLAHCCGSIGLRLTRNENLSERVCRPCARKIRNAAQLYSFIEKAASNTIVEEDFHWEAVEDRSKRQLPSTITPERNVSNLAVNSWKKKTPGKVNSRETLFAKSSTVSDQFNPRKWKKSLKVQNFEVVNSALWAIFTLCRCKHLATARWSDFPS